jgi:hypothetical protein
MAGFTLMVQFGAIKKRSNSLRFLLKDAFLRFWKLHSNRCHQLVHQPDRFCCAPSRARTQTVPLGGTRLRGFFCATGRLRRKQVINYGIRLYVFRYGHF